MDTINYEVPPALSRQNPQTSILSLEGPAFAPYGRLLSGIPADALIALADQITEIDLTGNRYVAGLPELEAHAQTKLFVPCFGGIPIQVGYCNGLNQTMNGLEYHKSSEINIAVTDSVLFLCLPDRLENFAHCPSSAAQAFFIPQGSIIELYPRILHLSPCAVHQTGFKMIIILPAGTNLSLDFHPSAQTAGDPEVRILFKNNKWLIAHPERRQLTEQGVYPGLTGRNRHIIPLTGGPRTPG
jgi:hypothetical protein